MSNSPSDERERQKRSHPKVRTGCQTCKGRRIKCDELKPICVRCRQSGRRCVYSVPKPWLFESQKDIVTLKAPPFICQGSADEQRAFQFFKENTCIQFAGGHQLAQKFWNMFIPRSATNDPLIYKLAVAMGSRHEATVFKTPGSSALADKSHALVISTLARNLSKMRIDLSLLCCAMLMGYANLCEEVPATAALHFSLGLKILREEAGSGQHPILDSMGAYIEPMFAELELATVLFAIPPADVQVTCPQEKSMPRQPESFEDLHEAKQSLADILSWLFYVTLQNRASPMDLTAKIAEADELLTVWRQTLLKYSIRVATTFPGLYMKARKMLFQYKLFATCRGAARNTIFVDACKVRVLSVDFSEPHITSILCALKRDRLDNSWQPLAPQPSRRQDEDDLDIWPQGESAGHDGVNQIVRIVLGR